MQKSSRPATSKLKVSLIICLIVIVVALGSYYYLVTLPPPPPSEQAPLPTPSKPTPFTQDLSDRIDEKGTILENVTVVSSDGLATFIIPKGTKALDVDGKPLKSITIEQGAAMKVQLTTPVGKAYTLLPEGATFDPPATLVISYDEKALNTLGIIGGGVIPGEDTLYIASYNATTSGWAPISGAIDTNANVAIVRLNRTLSDVSVVGSAAPEEEH